MQQTIIYRCTGTCHGTSPIPKACGAETCTKFGQPLTPFTDDALKKSDEEWKKELPPDVYAVTRQKGTEPPFSGMLLNNKETGMYHCSNCEASLFSSQTKFDSGSGWPSFDAPTDTKNVELKTDNSEGMQRTEVLCRRCGAHLGHLFDDGPKPTGQRYCVNSLALNFKKDERPRR